MSAARWCPKCGAEADRGRARGEWVCSECRLSTDTPLVSPAVTWTRVTVGFGGWEAQHAGHLLSVNSYEPGHWGWRVYRLGADPRFVHGDPVARGRTSEYRRAQRLAVGALAFILASPSCPR